MDYDFQKSLQKHANNLIYKSEVTMNNSNNIKNKLNEIYLIHWGDNQGVAMDIGDLKTYLLPLMIYKEISEKIENHLNKELINDKLTFEEAYEQREYRIHLEAEALEEVGYYLTPKYLFNVFKIFSRPKFKPIYIYIYLLIKFQLKPKG